MRIYIHIDARFSQRLLRYAILIFNNKYSKFEFIVKIIEFRKPLYRLDLYYLQINILRLVLICQIIKYIYNSELKLFLSFLLTRLICRSNEPSFKISAITYCSRVGTLHE